MEPVSAIIGIASGAAALVALTGQVVTYLVGLRDTHHNAELTILDLISTCQAYRTAWSHVERWAAQDPDHTRLQDSASTLSELSVFLETGQIIMNLMQRDIGRIFSKHSIWRRAGRRRSSDALGLLLHGKAVAEHVARIHRQNTSLNLLISVLTLPSRPLQEAAVEVLRPKFRKDEETAWTIVNTRSTPASRRRTRTLASSRTSVDFSVCTAQHDGHGGFHSGFTFEDDLFSGPVYKRLLISKLCEKPLSETVTNTFEHIRRNSTRKKRASTISRDAGLKDQQRVEIDHVSEVMPTEPASKTAAHHNVHEDNTLALELRQQGVFSRSVHEDFCEFMECYRPRKMQRRHLPLASVRIQNSIGLDEQVDVNGQFQSAVRRCDLDAAAKALDAGADINCLLDGQTALDFCVQQWLDTRAIEPDLPSEYTTMAEFLLLYKETYVTYMFRCRATILHLCMHIGATAEFMKPFFAIEGSEKALAHLDRYGRTLLHTAIRASTSGLFALNQLNKLFGPGSIPTNLVMDEQGTSAQDFARSQRAHRHLSILVDMAEGRPDERREQVPRLETAVNVSHRPHRIFVANPDPVEQLDDEHIPVDTRIDIETVRQQSPGSSQLESDSEGASAVTSSSGHETESWEDESSSQSDMSPVSTSKSMP